MFFTYEQNNSGGSYKKDSQVTKFVTIEAESAKEADEIAEEIGIRFDEGCECCGPRWFSAYGEGDLTPLIYGEPPEAHGPDGHPFPYAYVYRANGVKVTYSS